MKQQLADLVRVSPSVLVFLPPWPTFFLSVWCVCALCVLQGYKQDEVRHLTPSQAVEIITAGRPPTPRPISAASSTPTIATTSSFSFPSSSSTPASASVSSPEVALDASGRTRESADTVLLYSLAVAAPRVAADRPSPSSTTSLASSSSGVTAPPPPTTSKSIPTPTAITAIALTGLPPSST